MRQMRSVADLAKLGIVTSVDEYRSTASWVASARSVGDIWVADLVGNRGGHLSNYDTIFIGEAACELWRRHYPEKASVEMVDDWVEDGSRVGPDNPEQACNVWAKVWDYFKTAVLMPHMRTTDDVDPAFPGKQRFSQWVQRYEQSLLHAARREISCVGTGIAFVQEYASQFTRQDADDMRRLRQTLSELLCVAGRQEDGETVALALVIERPDHNDGYESMSNAMGYRVRRGDEAARHLQIEWLEEAMTRTDGMTHFRLAEILERLKAEINPTAA